MNTVYEKIGGDKAIEEAVDIFYAKVLANNDVSHFFFHTDMEAQHEKQKLFLAMALGGPVEYTSENLRAAHAPLVNAGLNEEHFNIVAGILKSTLEDMSVSAELINEAMSIVASTKEDILNR